MPTLTLDSATTLHYLQRGSGETCIVLLHGFPHDGRIWDDVLRDPPPGVRVLLPDLTGFGQSKSNRPFTIESLADDVHKLLLNLDVCPILLGGLSMGGYVALAYAKKYPMDLSGLMLLDTRAEGDSVESKEKRNKMAAMVRERGAQGSKAVTDQMLPNMLAKQNAGDQPVVSVLREIMESCPPKTIEHAVLAMRDREDQTDLLASIAIPTLIVVGEEDTITPKSAAEAMNRAIPRSTLIVIPGAGHMTCMEKPREVSRSIIDFVATV